MKTETRKVLVDQCVYIAVDGTEFDDEDECAHYEHLLKQKALEMYDENFERCDCIDDCYYAKLNSPEEVQMLIDVLNYETYCIDEAPVNPGIYMWRDGDWVNLTEIVEKLGGGNR